MARSRTTINDNWRFAPGEVERAAAADFDDRSWARVDLPHTWNAADSFDKTKPYRQGVGWYRKSLNVPVELRGQRLFLYFEGANQVADVFVNGQHAGSHTGGYTAFVFEITDRIQYGAPNIIAVRVDNSYDPDIPPLSADFTFYGGIYRNVWLIVTSPIHIDVTDHASPGVFITAKPDGTVHIKGSVVNQSGQPASVRVVNRVVAEDGQIVATVTSKSESFDATATVAQPQLWSPSRPYLYSMRTDVYAGDALVDSVGNHFGFRSYTVDAERGFALNGQPLRLYGTNRHQDYPGLGNALPDALHRRDVQIIKDTGFNFLRLAHYPQDPAVLDEADRLGLVIWEEIPIVDAITTSKAFADNCEQMLVEMIRQHYNHPSIFFWGSMNEVTRRKPDPLPERYYEILVALAQRLNDRAHAEDPGRKTVMALSRGETDDDIHGIAEVSDILGLNLYWGWYAGTFSGLGDFLDRIHRQRPNRPLLISEYGAGSDERIHSTHPQRFDFSSEYAQEFHRASFPQIESRPFVLAPAVWNQFDFGSPYREDTKFGINSKGLFFYDRTPKDASFYYQAALLQRPFLKIAREWSERAGDPMQTVWAYTNQPQVELFVNGRPVGSASAANRMVQWNVGLQPGENRIVARSGELEDSVTMHFDRSDSIAVNAGGTYDYIDAQHVYWLADRNFTGGEAKLTHKAILGTSDDALYQASREGGCYQFDVADGEYEVTIGIVENGYAVRRTSIVQATGGKGIAIDEPSVSAIFVRRVDGPQ